MLSHLVILITLTFSKVQQKAEATAAEVEWDEEFDDDDVKTI